MPVHDPRSTYTIGQSLRIVCHESKDAIERHFGDNWAEIRPGKYWEVGAGFVADREYRQLVQQRPPGPTRPVVLPELDLFVLPIAPASVGRSSELSLSTFMTILSGKTLSNIGIPLNPDLPSVMAAEGCRTLGCPVIFPGVWLVYHGLRHSGDPLHPSRQVFEGSGCRLTEVLPEDEGWVDSTWMGYDLDVLEWLRDANATCASDFQFCTACMDVHAPRKLRLLACEPT